MAKKGKDSLADFNFLDDIDKEFSSEEDKKKETKAVKKTEKKKEVKPEEKPVPKQRGRSRGLFEEDKEWDNDETKPTIILGSLHEELTDMLYFVNKERRKKGEDKVTMLGLTTRLIKLGMKEIGK
jgi:hypothetical protein